MRIYSIITSIALFLAVLGITSTASAQWPQTTDHNPWSVEIGGKFFDRPGTNLGLPIITNTQTLSTVFGSDDATDLGNTPAAEIKFNFESKTGAEWEFRSILANWEEKTPSILGPNLSSPFFNGSIGTISQFDYSYDSDFYSVELMQRRSFLAPGFVAMFGPRIISSQNTVRHSTRLSVNPGGGLPPQSVTVDSSTSAKNTLIGLQAGFEINRPISNGLYVSGFARAGGYYNPVKVNTSSSDSASSIVDTARFSTGSESFVGEAGGRIYMDLVPNVFSSYVGYEANWIDGYAAAPEQVFKSFSGDTSIETTNTIFFHGITFGVKYTY